MNTNLMKSQLLHHNHNNFFPIHSKTPLKSKSSSNFNLPPYYTPGVVGLGERNLCLSSKTEHWVIKSHHKEEEVDIAVDFTIADAEDDEEEWRRTSLQVLRTGAGAASIGLLLVLFMGQDKAWAFGPEGPMVEEFWENVRRYALYALTVSTGVLYAVLQPIVELLKNPISAILIIIIIGGSFFIFSQILSAMFGVSDFAYQYAY